MSGMMNDIAVPFSAEAESAVLGAILNDGNMDAVRIDVPLKANDFYIAKNQVIFDTMCKIDADSLEIDFVTVSSRLPKGCGVDAEYLKSLVLSTATSHAVRYHAKIVKHNAMRRRYIKIAKKIADSAADPQTDFEKLQRDVDSVEWTTAEGSYMYTGKELSVQAFQKIVEAVERGGKFPGQPTGWKDFDKITGGLCEGELVIIGARPSMGKTLFSENIAEYVAYKAQKHVAFFSLEMQAIDVMLRMFASQANINYRHIRFGLLKQDEYARLSEFMNDRKQEYMHICDNVFGVSQIKAHCRALKRAGQAPAIIIIDYLQIIAPERNAATRNDELAKTSRDLKILAKEMKCPVVVLSQLSRMPDKRPDKRPVLSDLRDSGAIEQDADLVVLLHREEYYNSDSTNKGLLEAIVAKARNGKLGTATLEFKPDFMRIENIHWDIIDKKEEQE